ncbi:hypothetical protein AALB_3684 [Agarivorans albus MKT 106]|uniref:Uncharacterized protein n=1 Tax=Agarivorans albus MKT 106 TaxID=1331007 RepID=R9PQH4_AGAAL|nr:hypothetical protein AALB_3684 [Agarivorans albus MKT 106]
MTATVPIVAADTAVAPTFFLGCLLSKALSNSRFFIRMVIL